jgi:uncharacterized membrane protein
MMNLDNFFLSVHVLGALMWIGGLFATMAFIDAVVGEPDAAARGRLIKHLRTAARVPDVGATIAIVFGAHWLFRFKLYEAHWMDVKLGLVALVIGLHVTLKRKVGSLKRGVETAAPPMALKPLLSLTGLAILVCVICKWPT